MRSALVISSAVILLAGASLLGQAQGPQAAPLTEKEVITGLKSKTPERIVGLVSERGVDFELTPEIEKKLRKAKADDAFIDIIRKAGPTARAQAAKQGGAAAGPKASPEEYHAFQSLRNELDPDKAIQIAGDFEKKFPNSSMLTWVYMFAATAYDQKNDVANAVLNGEKSIKLKADNLPTLLLLAGRIALPQFLSTHQQDEEKYLDEAEGYAQRALKLVADPTVVPKQANESDAQYARRKDTVASDAHASLGMVHLQRARLGLQGPDQGELVTAEKEYQQAIAMTDKPNPEDYYRLGEAYSLSNKLDEAIDAFTKASDLGLKAFADPRIEQLKKRKAGSKPPANP
jgi:tetratricopeptide (TPR) repeat protein